MIEINELISDAAMYWKKEVWSLGRYYIEALGKTPQKNPQYLKHLKLLIKLKIKGAIVTTKTSAAS